MSIRKNLNSPNLPNHVLSPELPSFTLQNSGQNANQRASRNVKLAYNTSSLVTNMSAYLEKAVVEDRPSGASPSRVNPERSLDLALAAARSAADNLGTNIVVLDMSLQSANFDYFVIATGTSRRQLHAMSEEIDQKLEGELNDKRMNIDGYDDSRWIVLDYGTVIIHLFDEDTRKFYSLESLWADAQPVDLSGIGIESSTESTE